MSPGAVAIPSQFAEATKLRDHGDFDGATQLFAAVVQRFYEAPTADERRFAAEALVNMGVLSARGQLMSEAVQLYDLVLKDFPEQEECVNHSLYNKGSLLIDTGRNEECVAELTRYLDRYPSSPRGFTIQSLAVARMNRGIALSRLGRVDEAVAELQRTVASVPADAPGLSAFLPLVMYNYAMTLRDAGRRPEAAQAFTELVARFAQSEDLDAKKWAAMAQYNKGIALAQAGDVRGAIESAEAMVALFGSCRQPAIRERLAKAAYNRALLFFHGGALQEACIAFREIERSFVPNESEAISAIIGAARRHDIFTIAALNPAFYAANSSTALIPSVQGAMSTHGDEMRRALAATITVVHPTDLESEHPLGEDDAFPPPESNNALLNIDPATLRAAVENATDPKERDELSKLEGAQQRAFEGLELHQQASEILSNYLATGSPFGVYLRNFDPEGQWLRGHDPGPPPHPVKINIQLGLVRAGEEAAASLPIPMLAISNPSPTRPDFKHNLPKLMLPNEHWQDVVEELALAAEIIIIEIGRMTPGVLQELAAVQRVGAQERTLVIICEAENLDGLRPALAYYGARLPELPVASPGMPELSDFPHVVVAGQPWPSTIAPLERLGQLPPLPRRWDGVAL